MFGSDWVEQGFDAALERKKQEQPSREKIFDGEKEARLIATSCSEPPQGRAAWTLELLADRMVELKIVDAVSPTTVGRTLKKNELQPHRRKCWVIPPQQNGEFVARMEDVLDIYRWEYDETCPITFGTRFDLVFRWCGHAANCSARSAGLAVR